MEQSEVSSVLEDLRASTLRLAPVGDAEHFDIDEIEQALSERERVVARLSELVARSPDAFTQSDADRVRTSLHDGRRALEKLMLLRRAGWTASCELSRKQYVLRTISVYTEGGE